MVLRKQSQATSDHAAPAIPTVSQLTGDLAQTIESRFSAVSVQGEISGWTRAASGHTYFTLKDDKACLSAVLWRSRQISWPVREGMKVIASGRITVYPPRGVYQLDCVSLTPVGAGDLQLAYEALKAKLQAEGLFDSSRKRQLPPWPRRIGVVTSRDGAALHDILTTLRRRMPAVCLVLRSTPVQGTAAAAEIARGIEDLNRLGDIDLLIVGRGGGSVEDLWAFNEEVVARAIARSEVPVISAVGHEVDFTIADFVADVRAATPTAAAELAVRDREEMLTLIERTRVDLGELLQDKVTRGRRELEILLRSRGLSRPLDLVRMHQQRLDDLTLRAGLGLRSRVIRASERLNLLVATLEALSPLNVLKRGYAMIERDSQPITRTALLRADEQIAIVMSDGRSSARIIDVFPDHPSDPRE